MRGVKIIFNGFLSNLAFTSGNCVLIKGIFIPAFTPCDLTLHYAERAI